MLDLGTLFTFRYVMGLFLVDWSMFLVNVFIEQLLLIVKLFTLRHIMRFFSGRLVYVYVHVQQLLLIACVFSPL